MGSNEALNLINSDCVFGYFLKNKTSITIYLEDGATLTGTILGKDEHFLSIMDNTILHLVQITKIIRIQAEVNVDSVTDLSSKAGNPKPKITPVLNEPNNLPPLAASAEENPNKDHYQNRLDKLVRNW